MQQENPDLNSESTATSQSYVQHDHDWEMGSFVIDTAPPTYVYRCECGAVTHDATTGELCTRCTTLNQQRRLP